MTSQQATGLSERLLTIKQFVESRPAFSLQGIRWLIFTRSEDLESAGALIRLGNGKRQRLLLDPVAFDKWLLSGEAGK